MNKEMWNFILKKLAKKAEIQTNPLRGVGFWFCAEYVNGEVVISSSGVKHKPRSDVSRQIIFKEKFEELYPIYLRRKNGEKISHEAQKITRHSVYIYAIFNYCGF